MRFKLLCVILLVPLLVCANQYENASESNANVAHIHINNSFDNEVNRHSVAVEHYLAADVECSCGPGINCTFKGGVKHCLCSKEYGDHDGMCEACACGPHANCTFENGKKHCHCPKGYELIENKCTDIDECQNQTLYPCYALNYLTICRNIEGSYRCDCQLGYNHIRYSEVEPKEEHCELKVVTTAMIITASVFIGFFVIILLVLIVRHNYKNWKKKKGGTDFIVSYKNMKSDS